MAEKSADVLRPVGAAQGPNGRGVGAVAVAGPNQQAVVYYTRPVQVPTPGGLVSIPAYTPAVIFGGTSHYADLSAKRWYTATLDGAGGFYLVAEADWPAFAKAHDAVRLEYITRTDVRRAQPRPPILLPSVVPQAGVTGYVFWLESVFAQTPPEVYGVYSDPILPDLASPTPTATLGSTYNNVSVLTEGYAANRLASSGTGVLALDAANTAWYTPSSNVTPGTQVTFPTLPGGAEYRCYGVACSDDGATWWALVHYFDQTYSSGSSGYLGNVAGITQIAYYALKSTAAAPIHAADWSVGYTPVAPIVVAPVGGSGTRYSQVAGIGGNGATITFLGNDTSTPDVYRYRTGAGLSVDLTSPFIDQIGQIPMIGDTPAVFSSAVHGWRIKFDPDGTCYVGGVGGGTPQGGPIVDTGGHADNGSFDPTSTTTITQTGLGATGDGAAGAWMVNGNGNLYHRAGALGTPWLKQVNGVFPSGTGLLDMSRSGKYLFFLHTISGHTDQLGLTRLDTTLVAPVPGPGPTPGSGGAAGSTDDGTQITAFAANAINPAPGVTVTLTVTTNVDFGPTHYYLAVLDETGHFVDSWGSGATNTTTLTGAAGDAHTYTAELRNDVDDSVGASSGPIAVTWAAGGYDPEAGSYPNPAVELAPISLSPDGISAISSYAVYGTPTAPTT